MRALLTAVAAVVLVDTVFLAVLSPLLPRYADTLGLSKTGAGILAGAFGAGVLVGAVPSGLLAARIGLRRTLLGGLALTAVTSVLFGVGRLFPVLVLTRFAAGVGSACSWTAAVGWLARAGPPERRGELIGVAMSAALAGALLGPVVGGAAAWVGTAVAFGAIAVACGGLGLWIGALPEPPGTPATGTIGAALGDPRVCRPLGLIVLPPVLFGALGVLIPLALAARGWGTAPLGALYVASAAIEALAHPVFGRWADRHGPRGPVIAGLAGSMAVLLTLAWAQGPWTIALLVVLASVAFGATFVPGMALLTRAADAAGLDGVLAIALANLAWALGNVVGAPGSGWLADRAGEAATYLLLAALCAVTLVAVVVGARRASPVPALDTSDRRFLG